MPVSLFDDLAQGRHATLSDCRRYRYRLWREWGPGQKLGWIMLNPSTADERQDDPTIRKCIGFAKQRGYHGIDVANLFAFRATDPRALFLEEHPCSEPGMPRRNFEEVFACMQECPEVVLAWGANAPPDQSMEMVLSIQARWRHKARVLGLNKDGSPKHPLYVPFSQPPVVLFT